MVIRLLLFCSWTIATVESWGSPNVPLSSPSFLKNTSGGPRSKTALLQADTTAASAPSATNTTEDSPAATASETMSAPAAAATATTLKQCLPLAEKARAYLTASTDPFHAVSNAVQLLKAAGFTKWTAGASETVPGGKYYYTVQSSTLVAFTVGQQEKPAGTPRAFKIIGGHTDSPNLRLKPRSKCSANKHNCIQLGVECYGGGLWHTWLDRDLSVSGKVLVRDKTTHQIASRLVQLQDPVARISTLCIHLQSADERKALTVNKETHTVPIVASQSVVEPAALEAAATQQLNGGDAAEPVNGENGKKKPDDSGDSWTQGQEPLLLQRIASALELDSATHEIADWDLSLYDVQPAALGGLHSEFLYSGRLDNLATVFTAVTALTQHDLSQDSDVSMICCFDHEEVGSTSSHGAGSPVLEQAMRQVGQALQQYDQHPTAVSNSYCMSIDMAHAVHPNYANKHESAHGPTLNTGIVIKTNSNQRYTTNSLTGFIMRELGRRVKVPIQEFCVKNDCPCGSTIGPTISARTGLRTIDAGMPQLSMHSCREVMGVVDLTHAVNLFAGFFQHFGAIDASIQAEVEY